MIMCIADRYSPSKIFCQKYEFFFFSNSQKLWRNLHQRQFGAVDKALPDLLVHFKVVYVWIKFVWISNVFISLPVPLFGRDSAYMYIKQKGCGLRGNTGTSKKGQTEKNCLKWRKVFPNNPFAGSIHSSSTLTVTLPCPCPTWAWLVPECLNPEEQCWKAASRHSAPNQKLHCRIKRVQSFST